MSNIMWMRTLCKHLHKTFLYKNEYFLVKNKLNFNKIHTTKTIQYLSSNIRITTLILHLNYNNKRKVIFINNNRNESSTINNNEISTTLFEQICSETLDSLNDFFEDLVETTPHLKTADIIFSDGVLTINLGELYGTYVINRQTPNKQIWLSSPISGPKRYDLVLNTNGSCWIYKHDGVTLHELLKSELTQICKKDVQMYL